MTSPIRRVYAAKAKERTRHALTSARISSAWSATIDFSRRFSSSSCRRRRISKISSPPYLLRQVSKVASEIPCRQHSSVTFAPASASFQDRDDLFLAKRTRFSTPCGRAMPALLDVSERYDWCQLSDIRRLGLWRKAVQWAPVRRTYAAI